MPCDAISVYALEHLTRDRGEADRSVVWSLNKGAFWERVLLLFIPPLGHYSDLNI